MVYVAASVALSVFVLDAFSAYTATDYLWPDLVTTSPVLRQLLNTHLSTLPYATEHNFDIFAPSFALLGGLSSGVDAVYVRRVLYNDLTTLPAAIQSLRSLSTDQVSMLVAPYCWVDLEKHWEFAYSTKRQARCAASEAANAAMYLESVLRNIDFEAWRQFMGGLFDSRIGDPIAATGQRGADWLRTLTAHTILLIDDEVQLWRLRGLQHFTLQYGTGTGFGLLESVLVENALGIAVPMSLKSIPTTSRLMHRKTCLFYDLFSNDFYAPSENQTMVRGTLNYFADTTPDVMACFIEGCPLPLLGQTLHDQVGWLAALDAKWVLPPPALVETIDRFRADMMSALVTSPALQAHVVPPVSLQLRPLQWADPGLSFYSGNPWCIFGSPLSFVQQTFGFEDVCQRQAPLTSVWRVDAGVFALLQLGNVTSDEVCVAAVDTEACQRAFHATDGLARALSLQAPHDAHLVDHNIGLFQYLRNQTQSDPQIQMQSLLDPTFAFFGWTMLYDWALGQREVLSLQGDVQTVNVISVAYPPVVSDAPPAPATLGPYLWYSAAMTTATLGVVSVVTLCLGCTLRSTSWIMFNPVVSAVYIGRYFLLARSGLALVCLSTATTTLSAPSAVLLQVRKSTRSLLLSSALAGEGLWLIYVLHEVVAPLVQMTHRVSTLVILTATWVALVCIDQFAPVTWRIHLRRECSVENLETVTCDSGRVVIGSWERLVLLTSLLLGAGLLAILLLSCQRRLPMPFLHVLLPPTLANYHVGEVLELDTISAVMCGLLAFDYGGVHYLLDTKLWRVVRTQEYGVRRHRQYLSFHSTRASKMQLRLGPFRHKRAWFQHSTALLGLGYLITTLTSNVAYLSVMSDALANDFGWSGFNTSGMHAYLATTFTQLSLTSTEILPALVLDTPALGMPLYRDTHGTIEWHANLARRELFNEDTLSLPSAVRGLRSMDPCQLPWMFTQYCYLDLNRSWTMASTAARQGRCDATMRDNGAVYLAAPLRNVRDWDAMRTCWGTSLEMAFTSVLEQTAGGRDWWRATTTNALPIDAEVALWRTHGLATFRLQWQNFKTTGFHDAIEISTAWGQRFALTIAHLPPEVHTDRQTSMRLYWAFASDLWAVASNVSGIGGMSLLREAPNFAFANTTPTQLLVTNTTLREPLQAGLFVLQSTLGPFGAIDTEYISVPSALRQFYGAFMQALANLTLSNITAQDVFLQLPAKSSICALPKELLTETPPLWNVGGNLICGSDLAPIDMHNGPNTFVSFRSDCDWWVTETIEVSTTAVLFAFVGVDMVIDSDSLCKLDVFSEVDCRVIYDTIQRFRVEHAVSFEALSASAVASAVNALDVALVQYITPSTIAATQLYQRGLLNGTDDLAWPFFGWCYLFDWVIGAREVVSFQGDQGRVRTITAAFRPLALVLDPTEMRTTLSYVCRTSAQYVTLLLISVIVFVLCYTLTSVGAINALHLLELNRIVGHVWVGRLLLLLRSATALWLLNMSQLTLASNGHGAQLVVPATPWYKVILVASELTWLVYVLNDLFSSVTQQYTPAYAWKSSVLTWAIAVGCQAPPRYSAILQRTCTSVDMDGALDCTTGYISIGRLRGVLTGGLVALGAVVSTAVLERWRALPPRQLRTPYLSSASYFTLMVQANDVECEIDAAFALMAGLISVRWRQRTYFFDIKSWRFHTC
ncbi:hypothetical protein SPRG_12624 [Saprolegnia parasitica CBS 223.65]|uniref:Uncharacterized protein n=1 Tax=Saprolegnia parasitica (strain CBS 223.65) TaxID=695850 RepID=A0A067C4S8_SAPPC|nr:hypothetical protein SPRG_12624 [Saprolegnia parasitica CBS 223.65]KDO21807.1 hypothetical protein SPRG_12624 [Saprolegnia parasitica CBS 223.65]|eukprot:XP_012207484.1 hypothetical protein SPRG_12624 [Saprolegnia parasitica CBS 223.65]